MAYYPHTDQDRAQMLSAIGVDSLDALFTAIPEDYRFPALNLPPGASELEVLRELHAASSFNAGADQYATFLGAGAYHHFIPSVVNYIIQRGEFLTSYTPYQPEVSQGTLQAVYEFQSMICALLGMEAANASHYDGGTSLAEAVTMAFEVARGKRRKVILSPGIHPQYREVARTYHQHRDLKIVGDRGNATLPDLVDMIDEQTMLIAVQYPDFFGRIEDYSALIKTAHEHGALVCFVTDRWPAPDQTPRPPGRRYCGGEGQSLGIPMSFGGPYLGFFATRLAHVRKIAGRIVGETQDTDGRRAFVMTLRPREQDIRRDKATSNICTNQGLMALAASIYLAALGKHGLRRVAELIWHKSHYAAAEIAKLPGFSVDQEKPFFREFVVSCPRPVKEMNVRLFKEFGVIGGYDLGRDFPARANEMLVCVTEMNTRAEIDAFVNALQTITAPASGSEAAR
ncbi:MAG: aminomethyl-transferring glycine dehydrogenase subunit GcvPA [Anaerolineae bacterium]|nr:aminomethyl-transferring glycine dehydrogenase subunit GcvPA [Anaerolineae bacterium]